MPHVVDVRRMNLFVLGKQHLDPRARGLDPVGVVDDIVALHATGAATPYLSLAARMDGFQRVHLDEEMYRTCTLAKVRCMRRTVHVVSRELLPIAVGATRHLFAGRIEGFERHMGLSRQRYREVADRVLGSIPEEGWTTREVREALGEVDQLSGILNLMCDHGLLLRWKAPGGWRSSTHAYVAFRSRFPDADLDEVDEEAARRSLVERYIEAFGPVTLTDISWWTGLTKTDAKRAVAELGNRVVYIGVDGLPGEHLILASQQEALGSLQVGRGRRVNILPLQDPYPTGYKDRERYLDREHVDRVFDKAGNATTCIFVDGRVVGVWELMEGKEPVVRYHLFEPQGKAVVRTIAREAGRMGSFIAGTQVAVEEQEWMVPLPERTLGSFMTPLQDKGRRGGT